MAGALSAYLDQFAAMERAEFETEYRIYRALEEEDLGFGKRSRSMSHGTQRRLALTWPSPKSFATW